MANTQKLCDKRYNCDVIFVSTAQIPNSTNMLNVLFQWPSNSSLVLYKQIDAKSASQGFAESRLPHFTEEESLEIQGSADFFGFNHYTAFVAYPTPSNEINPAEMGWVPDSDVTDFQDPTWYKAASSWLKV